MQKIPQNRNVTFVVSQRMTNELHLRGDQLLLYALINSLTNGVQECEAGMYFFLSVLRIRSDNYMKAESELIRKKYIQKRSVIDDGKVRHYYSILK